MFRVLSHGNFMTSLSLTCGGITAIICSQKLTVVKGQYAKADDSSPSQGTCPVAFMWRWTGKLNMPFNHPPIDEVRVNYDSTHYPQGLNGNFMDGDARSCGEIYGDGKGNGIFEDTENREIAKALPGIITMLQKFGLSYGAYVADVGAGTGLVTREMSKIVGDCGEVYAQEISPGFQDILKDMIILEKLSNVFVVGGNLKSTKLPTDAFDLVLVCDTYHHFEYPKTMCKSIHKALRKESRTGYLVVIDFHRDDSKIWSKPPGWVKSHVRASQDVFRAEIESAGFKLVAQPQVEGLTENYVMVFEPI